MAHFAKRDRERRFRHDGGVPRRTIDAMKVTGHRPTRGILLASYARRRRRMHQPPHARGSRRFTRLIRADFNAESCLFKRLSARYAGECPRISSRLQMPRIYFVFNERFSSPDYDDASENALHSHIDIFRRRAVTTRRAQ